MIRKRQKNGERTRRTRTGPTYHCCVLLAFLKREAPAAAGWGPLFHALFFLLSLRKVDCGLLGIALGFIELKRALRLDRLSLSVVLPLAVVLAVVLLALARSSACFSWRALFVVVFISSLCKIFIEIKGTLGHLRSETWSLLSNCWHSDITPYATIAIPAPMNKCMMKCTGNQAKLPSLCRRIDKG